MESQRLYLLSCQYLIKRFLMRIVIVLFICIAISNVCCKQNMNSQKEADDSANSEWARQAEETVNHWEGRKMILPDSLPIIHNGIVDYSYQKNFNAPIRIVTYLDGGCGVCVLNLQHWMEFIRDVKNRNKKCDFLFFIQTDDISQFQAGVISKIDSNLTWICDKKDKFINTNDLTDQRFQTALLNKKNEVIMIGNMMFRPQLEELYKKIIDENGN